MTRDFDFYFEIYRTYQFTDSERRASLLVRSPETVYRNLSATRTPSKLLSGWLKAFCSYVTSAPSVLGDLLHFEIGILIVLFRMSTDSDLYALICARIK